MSSSPPSGHRTIIVPEGLLDGTRVNVIWIPAVLHSQTTPLYVKKTASKRLAAYSLPTFDDEWSTPSDPFASYLDSLERRELEEDEFAYEPSVPPAEIGDDSNIAVNRTTSCEPISAPCSPDSRNQVLHLSAAERQVTAQLGPEGAPMGPPMASGKKLSMEVPKGMPSKLLRHVVRKDNFPDLDQDPLETSIDYEEFMPKLQQHTSSPVMYCSFPNAPPGMDPYSEPASYMSQCNSTYQQSGNATYQQPGGNATYQRPANVTYQQPAANATFQRPAANATFQRPAANATFQRPSANSTFQRPASSCGRAGGQTMTMDSSNEFEDSLEPRRGPNATFKGCGPTCGAARGRTMDSSNEFEDSLEPRRRPNATFQRSASSNEFEDSLEPRRCQNTSDNEFEDSLEPRRPNVSENEFEDSLETPGCAANLTCSSDCPSNAYEDSLEDDCPGACSVPQDDTFYSAYGSVQGDSPYVNTMYGTPRATPYATYGGGGATPYATPRGPPMTPYPIRGEPRYDMTQSSGGSFTCGHRPIHNSFAAPGRYNPADNTFATPRAGSGGGCSANQCGRR